MKKIIFIFLAGIIAGSLSAQSFEGMIVYKNSMKSKIPNITDEQLSAVSGTAQHYYIKGGNYKSVTNGTYALWQLFRAKESKLYSKTAVSDTIFWTDVSVNDDSIVKVELVNNAAEIIGYKCDLLILSCKSGLQKYYFNARIAVDPKLFVNHKYGNWYEFLKLSKALPLKMVIETNQFIMESVATEVKAAKVDDKEFQIPPGTITKEMSY